MQDACESPARPPATAHMGPYEPGTVLGPQGMVPRPAAVGSPKNGLHEQILGPLVRCLQSDTLKVKNQKCGLTSPWSNLDGVDVGAPLTQGSCWFSLSPGSQKSQDIGITVGFG